MYSGGFALKISIWRAKKARNSFVFDISGKGVACQDKRVDLNAFKTKSIHSATARPKKSHASVDSDRFGMTRSYTCMIESGSDKANRLMTNEAK